MATSSYKPRTSVLSLAGCPSSGSACTKSVIGTVCCQTSSFSTPSIVSASWTRSAVADGGRTGVAKPLAGPGPWAQAEDEQTKATKNETAAIGDTLHECTGMAEGLSGA